MGRVNIEKLMAGERKLETPNDVGAVRTEELSQSPTRMTEPHAPEPAEFRQPRRRSGHQINPTINEGPVYIVTEPAREDDGADFPPAAIMIIVAFCAIGITVGILLAVAR